MYLLCYKQTNISSEILTHIQHCALKASRRGRNVKVDCQTLPLKCGAEWKTWPSVCTKYWVVYFSIKYLIWYSNPKEMNSINFVSLSLMKKWFFNVYLMAKPLYYMSNPYLPKLKWFRFWSLVMCIIYCTLPSNENIFICVTIMIITQSIINNQKDDKKLGFKQIFLCWNCS